LSALRMLSILSIGRAVLREYWKCMVTHRTSDRPAASPDVHSPLRRNLIFLAEAFRKVPIPES